MSNSDIFMEDDIMTRADRSGIAITSEQDMIDLVLVMLGLQEPVPADLKPKPNLSFEQLYNIHLRKYIPIFWRKNIDFEKLFTSCKYKYGEHILYRFPGGKDCYRYYIVGDGWVYLVEQDNFKTVKQLMDTLCCYFDALEQDYGIRLHKTIGSENVDLSELDVEDKLMFDKITQMK